MPALCWRTCLNRHGLVHSLSVLANDVERVSRLSAVVVETIKLDNRMYSCVGFASQKIV